MFENITINLAELNFLTIIVRILLSVLVGGIIGLERNLRNRAAGLRTYILVSVGATIVMMTNQYVVNMYGPEYTDPTRMGAQVISGIGFLGAGTILVTDQNRVKGLTTAAGLWASATIGLAIGIGFYSAAILGGITNLIIMTLFKPLKKIAKSRATLVDLYIVVDSVNALNNFLQYCADLQINILNLRVEHDFLTDSEQEGIPYFISLDLEKNISHGDFIDQINGLEGINYIEELEMG